MIRGEMDERDLKRGGDRLFFFLPLFSIIVLSPQHPRTRTIHKTRDFLQENFSERSKVGEGWGQIRFTG